MQGSAMTTAPRWRILDRFQLELNGANLQSHPVYQAA